MKKLTVINTMTWDTRSRLVGERDKCVNQCFAKCDREFKKDTCEKPLNWQRNIAKTASCDTMCVIRCWSVFPPDFANNE
jgi:hypothetical protein